MISVLKHPLFIFASLAFWINQYLEKAQGIFIPFYHSYGDDLMAMPVVFGLCLQLMRWIHPKRNDLIFTKTQILVALIYFSVVFEGVLPMLSEQYTADIFDVFCYGLGTLAFYRFMNHPATVQSTFNSSQ